MVADFAADGWGDSGVTVGAEAPPPSTADGNGEPASEASTQALTAAARASVQKERDLMCREFGDNSKECKSQDAALTDLTKGRVRGLPAAGPDGSATAARTGDELRSTPNEPDDTAAAAAAATATATATALQKVDLGPGDEDPVVAVAAGPTLDPIPSIGGGLQPVPVGGVAAAPAPAPSAVLAPAAAAAPCRCRRG